MTKDGIDDRGDEMASLSKEDWMYHGASCRALEELELELELESGQVGQMSRQSDGRY